MGNERARQKKLAKKKKKREIANKRTVLPRVQAAKDSTLIGRRAANWEVEEVWLSTDWHQTTPMLVSGMLIRRGVGGDLAAGVLMLDRACLGIKSGTVRLVTRDEIDRMLRSLESMHGGIERVDLLTLQSVAFHAADYARSLGFAGDPDFPLEFLGPRPAELLDTPLAKPERPTYIEGPYDDIRHIMSTLARSVGVGNFGVTTRMGGGFGGDLYDDENDDEDDDDDEDDEA